MALKQAGCKVSAIEIDRDLVKQFKMRPEAVGIDIWEGDAREMPFSDSTFDGAVLLEVIEHVPCTESLLREIHRVLKPGAMLCVAAPTSYTEKLYWRLHPHYAENATHLKIFEKGELRQLLQQAGFSSIAVQTRNLIPAVSWVVHALLRSRSDPTGSIHNHLWVDRCLRVVFGRWSQLPALNKGLSLAARYFGKSWYVYATKQSA